MAPAQRPASSGSDNTDPRLATMDDRKRKRMLSNRESARRSRQRKQKQLEDLIGESTTVQSEINQISQSIEVIAQRHSEMEAANDVLRAQKIELSERLRVLNSVLQIAEDVSGIEMDIEEVPDCLMEPWQFPCSVQPEMFQC